MTFMFLYTAYSANVVALLQSAADDIDSVGALLASPLACGAQDVLYNRQLFSGMYAFHVELTAGYDQIQQTFLEDEKCNLGAIKYMALTYPYLALAHGSPVREQLRIGAIRIMEGGVQRRTVRRMLPARPRCGAGAAMFTAVRLRDVAPALRCLLAAAALAPALLALELLARRREIQKQKKEDAFMEDTGTGENTPENVA